MIGLTGALEGGLAIGLLIAGHVGWSTFCLVLCCGSLVWADRFYQKGMGLCGKSWELLSWLRSILLGKVLGKDAPRFVK